jgi:uncharacterized protein YgbK (DUF1537 family)
MPSIADSMFILADDLSGAADCAIAAARAGLTSVVAFDGASRVRAQVLAIDADSRRRTQADARAINAALWRSESAPRRLFYKKIDSTLRGHFAAEMAALSDAGAGVAIVAPAFPATGRITRDGRVLVGGVPLERTQTWIDERMSGEADVAAILRGAGLRARSVGLAAVRAGLRAELSGEVSAGRAQAIVCDAETDADLAAIAAASVGLPVYWVGSAGLAAHLPQAAGIEGRARLPEVGVAGPILVVVGSLSEVSRRQALSLEAGAALASFVAPPRILRAGAPDPRWQALRDSVNRALVAGGDVMIRIEGDGGGELAQGQVLCDSLARLLAPSASGVGALIATGGETARSVLSALGVNGLQMVREIEPGVPLSSALGPRPMAVVTKAGAFGSPAALLGAYKELSGTRSRGAGA